MSFNAPTHALRRSHFMTLPLVQKKKDSLRAGLVSLAKTILAILRTKLFYFFFSQYVWKFSYKITKV